MTPTMLRVCFLFGILTTVLASACYENRVACLDGDATNFDILADEACPDCCEFPAFSLDVARFWGSAPLVADSVYTDGAGNAFRLLRLRVYLSELGLSAGATQLPVPENPTEARVVVGGDTTLTTINANVVLLANTGSTVATVGRLRVGEGALTQVQGFVGFPGDFPRVVPGSAPGGSPLATQPGLLNFNDGAGYLTASLEVARPALGDTLRVDLRDPRPLTLPFPGPLAPLRGVDLTLELVADYRLALGNLDLTADPATVAAGLADNLQAWLTVVGVR